jgi:hypothetical protein
MNEFLNGSSLVNTSCGLIAFSFTFRPIGERPSSLGRGAGDSTRFPRKTSTSCLATRGGTLRLDYEELQVRAMNNADDAYSAAANGREAAAEALRNKAQVEALLSIGAAIQDLANAIRGKK